MVSLQQAAIFSLQKRKVATVEPPTSKKRKWQDMEPDETVPNPQESKFYWRALPTDQVPDIELNLDTPLPLEWQRCLDIKSGRIHFYNTRTQKRTSKDPRKSLEPPTPSPCLDLELNLACEPTRGLAAGRGAREPSRCNSVSGGSAAGGGMSRSPSWASLDRGDHEEMVAAVCERCHMLVMMCKAALSCPNCKFVHPPEQSSTPLIKSDFRLLCCKD